MATASWPLLGPVGLYLPLSSVVGFALVERWQWWRRRDQYLTRIEIGVSLRTADPRPHLRPAVDREAERVLQDHPVGLGVVCVLFGGLALAVVGAAGLRDGPAAALWALPSVVVGAVEVCLLRARRAMAQRWLARTPAPSWEARS